MSQLVRRRPHSPRRLRIAAVFVALATAIGAVAFGPLSASASTTASISGVVTGTDAPRVGLADVTVQLTLAGGTQVDYTTTDSTGAYSFTGLQAATYLVQFSDDYNSGHLGTTSPPIAVADGQSVSNVNGSLALGGTVTGTISLSTGPLSQPASVALIGQGADVTTPGGLFYIGTAADGTFSLTGIAAGSYTLAFAGPYGGNWAPQFWSSATALADATYFTVTPGETVAGKDAVLQPGSSVSGTVTGSGAPVRFGFVQATGADGIEDGNAMTAADGSYTITGLPAGSQTLKFTPPFSGNFVPQWWSGAATAADAQYFDVPAHTALTGYDADLTAGATISGTINDADGNPIPFSSAYALRGGDVFGTGGFANGVGSYSISGLSAGDYTVQFDASGAGSYEIGWWNGASSPTTATVIHVGDQQQVTGIDAALGAGASISGTVSGLTPGGTSFAAANATITAVRPDGSQASQVYADQTGAYTVGNLPAGAYQLHIEPQGDTTDFAPQWYLNAASQAASTPITVTAGQTLDGIDVTLAATATARTLTTSTPRIVGDARVGQILTARPGVWHPRGVRFAYQWLRAGSPIPGATGSHYRVVDADAGKTLTVSVTGSKTGYASATVVSTPTAPVKARPGRGWPEHGGPRWGDCHQIAR